MENPNTISGLIRARGEIAVQIELAQIALRRLITELDHVDATIRLFAPELATETIKTVWTPFARLSTRSPQATLQGASWAPAACL
jgi:hypothetical protein